MTSYPSSMGVTRAAKGSSGKWNWKPMSNSPSMTCDAALNPAAIGRQSLIKYYKFINNKDYPTKKKKKIIRITCCVCFNPTTIVTAIVLIFVNNDNQPLLLYAGNIVINPCKNIQCTPIFS